MLLISNQSFAEANQYRYGSTGRKEKWQVTKYQRSKITFERFWMQFSPPVHINMNCFNHNTNYITKALTLARIDVKMPACRWTFWRQMIFLNTYWDRSCFRNRFQEIYYHFPKCHNFQKFCTGLLPSYWPKSILNNNHNHIKLLIGS